MLAEALQAAIPDVPDGDAGDVAVDVSAESTHPPTRLLAQSLTHSHNLARMQACTHTHTQHIKQECIKHL